MFLVWTFLVFLLRKDACRWVERVNSSPFELSRVVVLHDVDLLILTVGGPNVPLQTKIRRDPMSSPVGRRYSINLAKSTYGILRNWNFKQDVTTTVTLLAGATPSTHKTVTPNLACRWVRINSNPDRSAPPGRVCQLCTLHPDLSTGASQPRNADDLRSTEALGQCRASKPTSHCPLSNAQEHPLGSLPRRPKYYTCRLPRPSPSLSTSNSGPGRGLTFRHLVVDPGTEIYSQCLPAT